MSEWFSVQIDCEVRGKDAQCNGTRMTSLPFVPFKGLSITWLPEGKTDDDEEIRIRIEHVQWDQGRELFIVNCEFEWFDGCQCTPEDDCCTLNNLRSVFAPAGSGFEFGDPYPIYRHQLKNEVDNRGDGWPPIGGESVEELAFGGQP